MLSYLNNLGGVNRFLLVILIIKAANNPETWLKWTIRAALKRESFLPRLPS